MSDKKYIIIGTAPSWTRTPWNDTNAVLASLNDAYQLKPRGFQRADEWFDPHPLNKLYHPKGKSCYAHQVPPGHYVRPATHLQWIAEQSIPVYLHPEYAQQVPAFATLPHCKPFPKADVEQFFGHYFTSTPQWMMAFAMMRGFRNFAVYGIHLATEQEYREQRPGFEYLIGRLLGKGKMAVTVADGMRHYTTEDGHVALPEESPVLQSKFQYAFDTRPSGFLAPFQWDAHKLQVKRDRLLGVLKVRPWWQPVGAIVEPDERGQPRKRIVSTGTLQSELRYLDAALQDTQQQMQRVQYQTGA
jgi:hypothetical protein